MLENDEIKILPFIKDLNGGSFNDLLNLIHQHPINSKISLQKIIFEKITNTKYLQKEVKMSKEEWIRCWKKSEKKELSRLEMDLQKEYLKFKKKKEIKFYLDKNHITGHFLRAGESIKKYQIIGEYLGYYCSQSIEKKIDQYVSLWEKNCKNFDEKEKYFFNVLHTESEYILQNIDSYEYRGSTAMIASSFPNLINVSIKNCCGVESRNVFIALQDIEKDEILAFDYGVSHDVKRMPYVELRKDSFVSFFKFWSSQDLSVFFSPPFYPSPSFTNLKELIDFSSFHNKLFYIFHTPSSFIYLFCNNIFSVHLSLSLLKLFLSSQEKKEDDSYWLILFFGELILFLQNFEEESKNVLSKMLERDSIMKIYQCIKELNTSKSLN